MCARPSFQVRSRRPSPSRSVAQHELGARHRRRHVVGALEHGAGLGQRRDHQRVPRRQALVVEARAHPLPRARPAAPRGSRAASSGAGPRPSSTLAPSKLPLAVAPKKAIAASACAASPSASRSSLQRPHVELALHALGVGVQRRAEAALGAAHLAQRPVERLAAHRAAAAHRPTPASRAGRRGPAARCRRASSRSGAPSRWRRPRSGQSRRRSGHRSRRAAIARSVPSEMSRSPRASRNSISEACGNFGARAEAAVDAGRRSARSVAQRLGQHRLGDRFLGGGQPRGPAE